MSTPQESKLKEHKLKAKQNK